MDAIKGLSSAIYAFPVFFGFEVMSMAYKAIYRKWRPMVFEDIVGQSHITQTLKNQITGGRIGHAYLFCGTRGTGKTTAAKIFARAVNCLDNKDGSPCNECEICRGILDGSIMDVTEIDAASNNGVDNIREIRDDTKYVTASARYRIYIIDEVHMLSSSAFNALLKTLEEPPEHVIFILATTEPDQIPQTILSRCQRYDFRRIKPGEIILRLKEIAYGEGFNITEDAYALIARLGDGSMRDAISVLERVVSTCGTEITYEKIVEILGIVPLDAEFAMAEALLSSSVPDVLDMTAKIVDAGRDLNVFVDGLIGHFRNLLVCKAAGEPEKLLDYSDEEIARFKSMAEKAPYEKIWYVVNRLTEAKASAKWVKSPRVIYEMAFVKMCVPELDFSNEAIAARISGLEEKLASGAFVRAPAAEPAEENKKAAPEKKEKKVSAKLFNPIPSDKLNSANPIVGAAKKWEKIVASATRSRPYLAGALIDRPITIDNDGFILLYDRKKEIGAKKMAENQLNLITQLVKKACGLDLKIKIAYSDELEDHIIDFWSLPNPEPAAENSEAQKPKPNEDPLNDVLERMEGFVDSIDGREFLTFNPDEEKFSQTSIDDKPEDDREEFFEDYEKKADE